MDIRAAVNLVCWDRARDLRVVHLVALQIATRGEWVPPGPEARSLRACASFFRWLLDKRRPEAEGREPGSP